MKQNSITFLSIVLLCMFISSINIYGLQNTNSYKSKIYSIITETVKKLEKEGITAQNASVKNVKEKYGTLLTQFDDEGRIGVILQVKNVSDYLITRLEQLGGNIILKLPSEKIISMYLPINKIEEVAKTDEILIIQNMTGAVTNTGSVTSEGDTLLHAINVRDDLNVKGNSIKVGVISDGCVGWAASQALGDLPASYTAANHTFLNGNKIGLGDEGTAMMEIVHDLAPNSDLYFYGALGVGGGSATMTDAIKRLQFEKRCNIIVDDLTYFDQPMFEDQTPNTGWTIAAASRGVIDSGVIYISSAGNWAKGGFTDRSHYQANFLDNNPLAHTPVKPLPAPIPQPPPAAGYNAPFDNLHDFDPSPAIDVGLKVIMPPKTGEEPPILYVILQWNDPWLLSPNDIDLYLYDGNFNTIKAQSTTIQAGAQNPYESVAHANVYPWPETLNVVINLHLPPIIPPTLMGMYIYGCSWVEYNTPQNSIWGQPGVPEVIATGAVPYNNINNIELFSSQGNYDVYYPIYQSREKPDIVSIDGGKITGTGGFGWQDPQGNWRFYGTSASAPHTAGMAGLLLSKCHFMTPSQVHSKFERTAIDLGTIGFDPIFGNGRTDIEIAMLEVDTTTNISYVDTMNNTTNIPMFFASANGYAISNIKITGGPNQPSKVNTIVSTTSGNPYNDAGIIDLGCPTINRWYNIGQTGGINGQFNAEITAYIHESQRIASGISSSDLRLIHWNGSYYDVLPLTEPSSKIGDTWKIKSTFTNASFSEFFIGHLTRGVDVKTVSNNSGPGDTTVIVKFSIENTGNGWDTISFRAYDKRGWIISPSDSSFSLTSNQKVNVNIAVTIPATKKILMTDTVWLAAKSVSDTTITDSSFATINKVVSVPTTPGDEEIPKEFSLDQNYPNPFNSETIIKYAIPKPVYVNLKVYNLIGQEVTLLISEYQDAGFKSVEFSSSDLPSGIYIYQLTAGEYENVKKMLLIK